MEKCDAHDKEIMKIRTEISQFKKDIYSKIDELFEEVRKPILSDKQIAALILSLIVYLVFTVNYISGNNYRSIENTKAIEKASLKDDKMMDILISIKEDVATLRPKQ